MKIKYRTDLYNGDPIVNFEENAIPPVSSS